MHPRPWLLLLPLLLLPALAQAQQAPGVRLLRQRSLLLPSSLPLEGPPFELSLHPGTFTLVDLDMAPGEVSLQDARGRVHLMRVDEDTLVLLATTELPLDEPLLLSLGQGARAGPLRLALVTRPAEVDVAVRIVRTPPPPAEEDSTRAMALHLLSAPGARPRLAVPQELMTHPGKKSFAQVDSMVRLGRRLFITLAVRNWRRTSPPWLPQQVRLRATLEKDGSFLEWPVPLVSGPVKGAQQFHVLTTLLPEDTLLLEVALDDADTPSPFQPLPLEQATVLP